MNNTAHNPNPLLKRNKYTFGLGTIGRDMLYSLVSMYFIVYITEAVGATDRELLALSGVIFGARIFDALNDPVMGVIVDNTRSKWGKFKPWIALGAVLSGIITVFLFAGFSVQGTAFVAVYGILYILWGIAFTINDISYWSLMPALSSDQKERERIGAVARICANVGLFIVVGGIIPITSAIGGALGDIKKGYMVFAIIIVAVLWIGQCITLFGVKEPQRTETSSSRTTLRGMLQTIFRNDQLLCTGICMALFMIGYTTTTSFGVHFFKYAYKDENMYPIFAVILGVSQIIALVVFPLFSKRFTRKQLYSGATILVIIGYIIFFFSPMDMRFIGIAGVLLFAGQAFIQLLMLVFLADTIEYGEWKLGKRNEGVSFAIQPFINKMGGAVASGVLGVTLVVSGINSLPEGAEASAQGLTMMKVAMHIFPLICIVLSYIIYMAKYRIDKATYENILTDLEKRRKEA